MKKPKTKKYYMESVLGDGILNTRVELSASKYNEALKASCNQFDNQDAVEGDEFYISKFTRNFDHNDYTEKQIEFCWGICSTYFITLECKEGICFRK